MKKWMAMSAALALVGAAVPHGFAERSIEQILRINADARCASVFYVMSLFFTRKKTAPSERKLSSETRWKLSYSI